MIIVFIVMALCNEVYAMKRTSTDTCQITQISDEYNNKYHRVIKTYTTLEKELKLPCYKGHNIQDNQRNNVPINLKNLEVDFSRALPQYTFITDRNSRIQNYIKDLEKGLNRPESEANITLEIRRIENLQNDFDDIYQKMYRFFTGGIVTWALKNCDFESLRAITKSSFYVRDLKFVCPAQRNQNLQGPIIQERIINDPLPYEAYILAYKNPEVPLERVEQCLEIFLPSTPHNALFILDNNIRIVPNYNILCLLLKYAYPNSNKNIQDRKTIEICNKPQSPGQNTLDFFIEAWLVDSIEELLNIYPMNDKYTIKDIIEALTRRLHSEQVDEQATKVRDMINKLKTKLETF